MSQEKKLAVLIDSDNVSAKYAHFIMAEAEKYGTPTYKRVYGDWEKGGNGWHNPAINYSIMPVQQTSYIAGKNATDFSMIIDAMDILYSGRVDGFVLVTSDSDFTRLAIRLREAGMLVVGIGELKTPRAFTASCTHFCYLNQVCLPDEGEADEKTIRRAVIDYVTENKEQRIDLARISAVLTSKFGNINFDELGYKRFSSFIDSFPELRRSNTFVTLRKKREEKPAPAALPAGAPTEADIVAAIDDYFSKNAPVRDNMLKLESYLTSIFGIIDFSRFGSKRFARFIDKLDGYTRNGTDIAPAKREAAPEKPAAAPALAAVAEAKPAAAVATAVPETPVEAPAPEVPEIPPEKPTASAVSELVLSYAGKNMPDGGNLGQLNNELMSRFGKGYLSEMGYDDIKSMLATINDIRVRRNHVFLTDMKFAEYVEKALSAEKHAAPAVEEKAPEKAAAEVQAASEKPAETPEEATAKPSRRRRKSAAKPESVQAEIAPEKQSAPAKEKPAPEKQSAPAKEKPAPEKQSAPAKEKIAPEKQSAPEVLPEPEINAVKREVLLFASSDETGSIARLGNILATKYGKGWLKKLGFGSVKSLLSSMKAVTVKGSNVTINEEFAKQTEEIEAFVLEFAKTSQSKSMRALSTQLKKRFEQFDIADYGFAKFIDFIGAIDGVKADRYHVSLSE
ncbi:MAG: NYN domain-containing protein [Oscillospiraceae bacterium]